MKTLKDYFQKAKAEKWAIGQFNFSVFEQLKGILSASLELNSPLILGTSEKESDYFGLEEITALCKAIKKKYKAEVFLNLDHAKNPDLITKAIKLGYDGVHYDGSLLSYEENIKNTKGVVEAARKKNVFVEGELGVIKGESTLHKKEEATIKDIELTLPSKAQDFIEKTGVDSLAISVGTIHGIYEKEPQIDFERLEKINKASKSFLVLHGGSGISEQDLKKAISLGINKINFNTELRFVWRDSLLKVLERAEEYKPYNILPEVQDKIKQKVEEKINILGSKNKKI